VQVKAPTKSIACCESGYAALPHPFTAADRPAGYRYQLSILQAEFSLTQVLDRPVTCRVFFEEVIRENLDIIYTEINYQFGLGLLAVGDHDRARGQVRMLDSFGDRALARELNSRLDAVL
jgi:hypothetical protein